jgi:hypothetical protein
MLGALILLLPLTALGQDSGTGPEEEGCTELIDGSRVTVTGDCYFTPPWLQASSVELHGTIWGEPGLEVIHLTSGSVRTFNFSQEKQVQIVAERGDYRVAAVPADVTEAGFDGNQDVVYFSRKGDTTLLISYENEPRVLHQGEGLTVGLSPPPSNGVNCSFVRSAWVGPAVVPFSRSKRVDPVQGRGEWFLIAGLTLLVLSGGRRWIAVPRRAPRPRGR